MLDALHRAMTGQTMIRTELRFAAAFIAVWFLMDVWQFADFILEKIK